MKLTGASLRDQSELIQSHASYELTYFYGLYCLDQGFQNSELYLGIQLDLDFGLGFDNEAFHYNNRLIISTVASFPPESPWALGESILFS